MEIHAKVMVLMMNLFVWRLAARGVRPGSFYDVAILSIWAALGLRLSKMVPKLVIWSIGGPWVQYMYRDWRPSESQTCRGLSVRLGDSLHRAEGSLHVFGDSLHRAESPPHVQR